MCVACALCTSFLAALHMSVCLNYAKISRNNYMFLHGAEVLATYVVSLLDVQRTHGNSIPVANTVI